MSSKNKIAKILPLIAWTDPSGKEYDNDDLKNRQKLRHESLRKNTHSMWRRTPRSTVYELD